MRMSHPVSKWPWPKRWCLSLGAVLFAATSLAFAFTPSFAEETSRPKVGGGTQPVLVTNERGIAEVLKPANGLKISDPKAVFAYVLENLPPRVKVYPTENYYYFAFTHGGVSYGGNLRLDAGDRDKGKLHFAYYRQQTSWMGMSAVTHLALDKTHGVEVTRAGPLTYRVKNGVAAVVFDLNDLSAVKPPSGSLVDGEQVLGPVFDESGVRFFLIYNRHAKLFHYVLDETAPLADRLAPTGISDRIQIGMRTGFAFYEDHRAKRNILIGVYAENERLNTHLDGPFDQLPDNFIEGENLRQAILEVEPDLAGQIGRLGHYHDREMRYLIAPYIRYRTVEDLAAVHDCAVERSVKPTAYAACFSIGAVDAIQ